LFLRNVRLCLRASVGRDETAVKTNCKVRGGRRGTADLRTGELKGMGKLKL